MKFKEESFGQWKVDTKGNLEDTLGYEYWISADRLKEPDWEEHMSQKSWVNMDEFTRALRYAKNLVTYLELRPSLVKP